MNKIYTLMSVIFFTSWANAAIASCPPDTYWDFKTHTCTACPFKGPTPCAPNTCYNPEKKICETHSDNITT